VSDFVDAVDVRRDLIARREIAILDVRPEKAFAQGHPMFAASLPLAALEAEAPWRLPRRGARVVVYDDGEGLAAEAATRLANLGYGNVRILTDGLIGWRAAGYEVFTDVNSPSKAFGELVETRRGTPSLGAPEVAALIARGADMVILDARRFDEYQTMSIPGAVSAPGAELVLRARALAPDRATKVIVNCAGRTRSLIGAQSLINAGLPNPVAALRNGTMGWRLAGLTLEHGQDRRPGEGDPAREFEARTRAREVAYRAGVRRLGPGDLQALTGDGARTLYRFDVRQADEFEAGHISGFLHAPGGQLVQETDHHAPVRGARIVLADPKGSRADMTASWLAQMGWEVFVLDAPATMFSKGSPAKTVRAPAAPGDTYRRPYLGAESPLEAMRAYLDWEAGLVDQLARDGTHGFFVI
jgi:rhodanese-related sulfurtransferase